MKSNFLSLFNIGWDLNSFVNCKKSKKTQKSKIKKQKAKSKKQKVKTSSVVEKSGLAVVLRELIKLNFINKK